MTETGWNSYRLSDIIILIGGGTPRTTNPEYWNGNIPWLSVADFNYGYRYVSSSEKTITPKAIEESSTTLLKKGQLIISARGTVGIIAQLCRDMAFNQSCYGITAKDDLTTNDFLYYLLNHEVRRLKQMTHGAVFDTITRDTFDQISVDLPPLPTQHAIARILSSLDDKIELNRQMNETLEAMARAIFQSWFVDFDPVRAKAEGRDTGLPPEVAGLFPDGFEEVEGREVPRGWGVEPLGNVIELGYGKALKQESRLSGKVPVYGSNGQIGWHDEKLVDGPGIIVGRKGNPGIIHWSATDFFPIDTTFFVILKGDIMSLYYLYHELQRQDLPSLGADSAVPGLNRNLVYMSKILVPSPKILEKFDVLMKSLDQTIQNNINQSRILAQIRDALLPKLMSGDIQVEAES